MRNHRIFGVAIAVLLGTTFVHQRPSAPHHHHQQNAATHTEGTGMQLASAALPAAPSHTSPATGVGPPTGLLRMTGTGYGHAGAVGLGVHGAATPHTCCAGGGFPHRPVAAGRDPVRDGALHLDGLRASAHPATGPEAGARGDAQGGHPGGPCGAGHGTAPRRHARRARDAGGAGDHARRRRAARWRVGRAASVRVRRELPGQHRNGYYGAYQFSLATWRGVGFSGLPSNAPPAVQDQAAQKLQARSGWGQWPACSRRLGLI